MYRGGAISQVGSPPRYIAPLRTLIKALLAADQRGQAQELYAGGR
jgi:hypothetical protein